MGIFFLDYAPQSVDSHPWQKLLNNQQNVLTIIAAFVKKWIIIHIRKRKE